MADPVYLPDIIATTSHFIDPDEVDVVQDSSFTWPLKRRIAPQPPGLLHLARDLRVHQHHSHGRAAGSLCEAQQYRFGAEQGVCNRHERIRGQRPVVAC